MILDRIITNNRHGGVIIKKVRKPRGLKQDGTRSYDMCTCCLSWGCDPMAHSNPYFNEKKFRRSMMNVCRSCGSDPCKCKSKLVR